MILIQEVSTFMGNYLGGYGDQEAFVLFLILILLVLGTMGKY